MSIPDFYTSNSTFDNTLQGACLGAAKGAIIGTSIVYATLGYEVAQSVLEAGNRIIGNEPVWPRFEGDCELKQFQDLTSCSESYLFDSLSAFTAYTIGLSSACGLIIGAVYSVSKSIFEKKHR